MKKTNVLSVLFGLIATIIWFEPVITRWYKNKTVKYETNNTK